MRGYTVKKGNQYYAVVYEGLDPATGKEKRRWVPGGPRRGDAEKLLTELVKRANDGLRTTSDKITLGDYLTEKWLPIQQAQLRPSTFDSYRRNIENHVIPAIGRIPLQKLAPEDLDTFYARLLTSGRRNGDRGGLAPKTVRSIHRIIHKALKDALRKGSVVRNVAEAADPPKLTAAKQEDIKAWTAEELRYFLGRIRDHRLYPAIHLSSHTGMRRGEILGLRWSDVDFDEARLAVRQALISVAYEVQLSDVKTDTGRRTIDLDEGTVAILRRWKKEQTEERLAAEKYTNQDQVFCRPDGTWLHPDLFSKTFDRMVAKSGLPPISLHDLRHTHATLMLRAGVKVKVVSERLGHSSPAFTMSVYQHVLPGMQAEAAALFAKQVSG